MASRKLTVKQRKFVDEYLQSGNGTQAAIKAGYAEKGARVAANRLLTNDNIKPIIQKRQKKAADKADVSLEWVLKQVKNLSENAKKDGDKLKALDMLIKHKGGYEKNNKHSLDIDIDQLNEIQIAAIGNLLIQNLNDD